MRKLRPREKRDLGQVCELYDSTAELFLSITCERVVLPHETMGKGGG